jgi:hypothetical protein
VERRLREEFAKLQVEVNEHKSRQESCLRGTKGGVGTRYPIEGTYPARERARKRSESSR